MQSRRSKRISILIVPEDNAEPYSFRIKTRTARLLYVLGALLLVHMVMGGVFYWKYADLSRVNQNLVDFNAQLQRDNKRVVDLADKLYALEMEYKRVSKALGVDPDSSVLVRNRLEAKSEMRFRDQVRPAVFEPAANGTDKVSLSRRRLLIPKQTAVHEYAPNIPTLLPVIGYLTLDFQSGGWLDSKTHTGIDIVARKGTVVRAAGGGVVIFSNWTLDLGYLIIIDHGNGLLSYYAHNQRLLKPEKSRVKKGEPIALLGTSGRSSGPHLHFEIWKDGRPVDPKEYILAFDGGEAP